MLAAMLAESAPATLQTIRHSPMVVDLEPGENVQCSAFGNFSDGSVQDLTLDVQWSLSSLSILSIDSFGLATAMNPGSTTVAASTDGVTSNQAQVQVTEPQNGNSGNGDGAGLDPRLVGGAILVGAGILGVLAATGRR